jgi:hypothetical protein
VTYDSFHFPKKITKMESEDFSYCLTALQIYAIGGHHLSNIITEN